MTDVLETRNYSLPDVTLNIGPCLDHTAINVTGYGEDGSIEYEKQAQKYEYTVGADGLVVVKENHNMAEVVTLSLRKQAAAYARLAAMARAQYEAQGLPPCPYIMVDPNNGDEISDPQAEFLDAPTLNKTKSESDGEFSILLPHGRRNEVHGATLLDT
jgi:hypothetical protein